MNKREFIKTSSLALAAGLVAQPDLAAESIDTQQSGFPKNIIKPARIHKGDQILILAPGTNVTDSVLIRKAIKTAEMLGYNPAVHRSLRNGFTGKLTNSPENRAEAIMEGFLNPDIRAIWCIRGGYGSVDLLDKLDYGLIAKNPKLFVGYSDITALHSSIYIRSGLITLHAPVMLSKMTDFTLKGLQLLLDSGKEGDIISLFPKNSESIKYTIRDEMSEGRLLGGNLSLVTSLIGTPYIPSYNGAIVFLEDVGEAPYRLHRMLKQVELSGMLVSNRGLIFGRCTDCSKGLAHISDYTENEVYLDIASRLDSPVSLNNYIGHTADQASLPHGLFVAYDPGAYQLRLQEDLYQ